LLTEHQSGCTGKSSLKPEDAIPDYKTLEPAEMKVLDQWYDFFSKVSLPLHGFRGRVVGVEADRRI
jgi:hypothetical protein